MKAIVFHGIGDIRLDAVDEPIIQDPSDAIVRLTSSAICGTNLHMIRANEPIETIRALTEGIGADRVIDAVGVDAEHPQHGPAAPEAKEHEQRFQQELQQIAPEQNPQGDNWHPGDAPSQVLTWAVEAVAKAGTLAIMGVYPASARSFPIGKAMGKNLTLQMGNCRRRKYLPMLVGMVRSGVVDPTSVLTQIAPLSSAIEAYKAFDQRRPGWIKVELQPAA